MASKNGDLLYFGGPCTDYQCHSETTSNQPHYHFEVQLLGLGPCGFLSCFFYFDVQYEVLFRVLLIITSKNVVGFCRHRKNEKTFYSTDTENLDLWMTVSI